MASESHTYRVFISSSMEELAEERQVIKQAVEGRPSYLAFTYEDDAGARPYNHEETFLKELNSSNLYVGIFWNKFGKFTIGEFLAAKANGIPCLIFEKTSKSEDRAPELQEFLNTYNQVTAQDGIAIGRFDSLSDLREKFNSSFAGFLAEAAKRGSGKGQPLKEQDQIDTKANLPVLCNREEQDTTFRNQVLNYFETHPRRPLLLILPGVYEEGHWYYLKRTEWHSLKKFLAMAPGKGGFSKEFKVQVLNIPGGLCSHDSLDDIRGKIGQKISRPVSRDDSFLSKYIKDTRLDACLIGMSVSATECEGNFHRALSLISQYLAGVPDVPQKTLFGVLVSLVDDQGAQENEGWLKRALPFLARAPKQTELPSEKAAKEFFEQSLNHSNLQIQLLPRLESPKLRHGRNWRDDDEVNNWLRTHSPNSPLSYEEIEEVFGSGKDLPMEPLYHELFGLLVKRVSA